MQNILQWEFTEIGVITPWVTLTEYFLQCEVSSHCSLFKYICLEVCHGKGLSQMRWQKSPQSLAPDCICTSSSATICCFTTAGAELYKLSYTNTLGCLVPMVLIVSQWPALCSIWTNSFASMLKAKTLPGSLFCKPGRPNCLVRMVCAALMMSEFSHSVGLSRIPWSSLMMPLSIHTDPHIFNVERYVLYTELF